MSFDCFKFTGVVFLSLMLRVFNTLSTRHGDERSFFTRIGVFMLLHSPLLRLFVVRRIWSPVVFGHSDRHLRPRRHDLGTQPIRLECIPH